MLAAGLQSCAAVAVRGDGEAVVSHASSAIMGASSGSAEHFRTWPSSIFRHGQYTRRFANLDDSAYCVGHGAGGDSVSHESWPAEGTRPSLVLSEPVPSESRIVQGLRGGIDGQ